MGTFGTCNQNIFNQTELSATERLVYIMLDCKTNLDGKVVMSYPEIAKATGISKRQAMRCVEGLVQAGILNKETVIIEGWGGSKNQYEPILKVKS